MAFDWRAYDFLRNRKRAFIQTFRTPVGQEVLMDLAKFCRASKTCFDADPRKHAVLEGRREVWLRIQEHLNLSSEQIYGLLGGHNVTINNEETDND